MKKVLFTLAAMVSMMALATPAHAAPPQTLDMSSWQPEVVDDVVVGGTQSITVVNHQDVAVSGVSFDLSATPCACAVDEHASSHGTVDEAAWHIGELLPGETATLTLRYSTANGTTAAAVPSSGANWVGPAFVIAALTLLTMIARSRRSMPQPTFAH